MLTFEGQPATFVDCRRFRHHLHLRRPFVGAEDDFLLIADLDFFCC